LIIDNQDPGTVPEINLTDVPQFSIPDPVAEDELTEMNANEAVKISSNEDTVNKISHFSND